MSSERLSARLHPRGQRELSETWLELPSEARTRPTAHPEVAVAYRPLGAGPRAQASAGWKPTGRRLMAIPVSGSP